MQRTVEVRFMIKAKDYLMQVRKIEKIIENKRIELEQWKDIATGITSHSEGDRVQSSGSKQKTADAVCRYVDIEEEINRYIVQLVERINNVLKNMEQLETTEYDVLHIVYIQNKTLSDAADKYKKAYSWATTVHGRALKHLQKIIDKEYTE